jgi:hypothetical protein
MNRAQHVEWTKSRALQELAADGPDAVTNAISSFMSDLAKHPDTEHHAALMLGGRLALAGHLQTAPQVREFIEGIN